MFAFDMESVDMNPPEGLPPVQEPNWLQIYNPSPRPQLTWLGHASFLLQMDGFNVLTDPLFTHRCSPFQWIGPARYTPLPPHVDRPDALPQVHLVVISHNHYDHTSLDTIHFLHSRERLLALRAALQRRHTAVGVISASGAAGASGKNPVDDASLYALAPHWLVPLGIAELLRGDGVPDSHIHELDWYGHACFTLTAPVPAASSPSDPTVPASAAEAGTPPPTSTSLVAVCTPCQHFSGRTLWDRNDTLWATWSLVTPATRFWFAGGLCRQWFWCRSRGAGAAGAGQAELAPVPGVCRHWRSAGTV